MAKKEKIQKHIHKLKRHKYSNEESIYFCTLNCGYRILCKLALGKEVICNRCNNPFVMNEYSITLYKPHCTNCHKHKNLGTVEEVDIEILADSLAAKLAGITPKTIDGPIEQSEKLERIVVNDESKNLRERLKKSIENTLNENADDLL